MANGFLCALFPYLLGVTLFLVLLWPVLYLIRPKRGPDGPNPASVGILWLTPACAKALGRCSQPGRLRSMSARGISARLDRYDFPANERRPTPERYSTWPDQADLICQGKFDELASKQSELIAKLGVPENQPEPANLKAGRGAWAMVLDALLVVAFILAVLTLLNWILTDFLRACAPPQPPCEKCPTVCKSSPEPKCEKPAQVQLKLSTDQEFEYNEFKIVDSQRLKDFLAERLTQFKNAKLTITGFTDPIGGVCYNEGLADNRAKAIAEIVKGIIPDIPIESKAAPRELPDTDKMIAAKCMKAFQDSPPGRERPLRFFSNEERDYWLARRCEPDPKDVTPDHILGRGCEASPNTAEEDKKCPDYYIKEYKKDATFVALKRATNFYRLQRCLAPLRRVEIKESASGAGK
jgi:hypothetical protein